ncbi:unnamed protein product [Calypogeia fissa]
MICYFTDRAPLLQDFKDWISFELGTKRGWPTSQIKFLGKNFFLIHFDNPAHRDDTLILAPWFMDHRFVYTFKWEAHFDVRLETYTTLPVWIELPFRSLLLENCRQQVAGALGKVLYYVQGNEYSTFPHDRACILWEKTHPVPKSIKINLKDGLAIWQPVTFRNIPYHCYKCNRRGHLARECPGESLEPQPAPGLPAKTPPAQENTPPVSEAGTHPAPIGDDNDGADGADDEGDDNAGDDNEGEDGEDADEQMQIATSSLDVEPIDAELEYQPMQTTEQDPENVTTALNQVTDYIERLAEESNETPLDAATQTPQPNGAPTIAESDEDKSEYEKHFSQGPAKDDKAEYEKHFSQGPAKDDKARKLANRTPEANGKAAEKIGKKQRKQLQFNTQLDPTKRSDTGRNEPSESADAAVVTTKEQQPSRRTKASSDTHSEGASLETNPGGKGDRRRGKEAAAGNSPGK